MFLKMCSVSLDENPQAMRTRRETVEHPFGTIKARMGATHFLMKRLHNVKTEMSLAVLAYNLTRVMNIIGIGPLIAAVRAICRGVLSHHRGQNAVETLLTPYRTVRSRKTRSNRPQPPNHLSCRLLKTCFDTAKTHCGPEHVQHCRSR